MGVVYNLSHILSLKSSLNDSHSNASMDEFNNMIVSDFTATEKVMREVYFSGLRLGNSLFKLS